MVYKWLDQSQTWVGCPSGLSGSARESHSQQCVDLAHNYLAKPVLDLGYYLRMQTSTALEVRADLTVHLPQHGVVLENHLLSTRPVVSGPLEKILFKEARPVKFVPANCLCISHVMQYCSFFRELSVWVHSAL